MEARDFFVCFFFASEERESWIRAKYEQRAFVPPLQPQADDGVDDDDDMPARLLSAVTERDLARLLLLLAHSSKEAINAQPAPAGTALHAACQLGDVVMTQLLIWVRCVFFFFSSLLFLCQHVSPPWFSWGTTTSNCSSSMLVTGFFFSFEGVNYLNFPQGTTLQKQALHNPVLAPNWPKNCY